MTNWLDRFLHKDPNNALVPHTHDEILVAIGKYGETTAFYCERGWGVATKIHATGQYTKCEIRSGSGHKTLLKAAQICLDRTEAFMAKVQGDNKEKEPHDLP